MLTKQYDFSRVKKMSTYVNIMKDLNLRWQKKKVVGFFFFDCLKDSKNIHVERALSTSRNEAIPRYLGCLSLIKE